MACASSTSTVKMEYDGLLKTVSSVGLLNFDSIYRSLPNGPGVPPPGTGEAGAKFSGKKGQLYEAQ